MRLKYALARLSVPVQTIGILPKWISAFLPSQEDQKTPHTKRVRKVPKLSKKFSDKVFGN
ncbi:hypothetical protein HMPREF9136_2757 [Prevotella dentalis DSM 3688]|uniref:Uncharacterized protein n=1 Tax=Prevotella dentalis (strain ATCC 49559 / DSM 3688 / JCM 13448 / NCTC 12043 / ES 2772) TaxID=908937 RepID=F9D7C9_PREDD|nr:hypothetical protein HMPREF9136_2757 [Prevotella dentalis DSM 3688]